VLARDIRFEGWTTEAWMRFLNLWAPHEGAPTEGASRGGVVALHDGTRIRKLVHTRRGRLDPVPWPIPLPELAAQHEASWAMSARIGALEEVMERFGARAKRKDDLLAQSLSLVTIVRELIVEGRIDTWPRRLRGIPIPNENVVRRALDAICPAGHALALGIFKDGELWTTICARRTGDAFDVIAGPEDLRPAMGVLSSDWRRDYRHLARAIEDRYAPLAMGVFAELDVFRELQVDPRPGAWSRAVALRDLIVSPMPAAVGVAVGVDGARYAASKAGVILRRIDWFGFAEPMISAMRQGASAVAGNKDLESLLGFSPLEVLRNLLKRDE